IPATRKNEFALASWQVFEFSTTVDPVHLPFVVVKRVGGFPPHVNILAVAPREEDRLATGPRGPTSHSVLIPHQACGVVVPADTLMGFERATKRRIRTAELSPAILD